jgi:hypothetical protein
MHVVVAKVALLSTFITPFWTLILARFLPSFRRKNFFESFWPSEGWYYRSNVHRQFNKAKSISREELLTATYQEREENFISVGCRLQPQASRYRKNPEETFSPYPRFIRVTRDFST